MKTLALNQTIRFAIILGLMPLMWACGGSSKSGGGGGQAASVSYQNISGYCYNVNGSSRILTAYSNCGMPNTNNQIFIYDGQQCYDHILNGVRPDRRYCTDGLIYDRNGTCYDHLANANANQKYCLGLNTQNPGSQTSCNGTYFVRYQVQQPQPWFSFEWGYNRPQQYQPPVYAYTPIQCGSSQYGGGYYHIDCRGMPDLYRCASGTNCGTSGNQAQFVQVTCQ